MRSYFDIWDTAADWEARGLQYPILIDLIPVGITGEPNETVEHVVQKHRWRVIGLKVTRRWKAFIFRRRLFKWRRALKLRIVPRSVDSVRNVLATNLAVFGLLAPPRWTYPPKHPMDCDEFRGVMALKMSAWRRGDLAEVDRLMPLIDR